MIKQVIFLLSTFLVLYFFYFKDNASSQHQWIELNYMSPIAFRFLNKNILSHINLQKDFNMNEISSLLTLFNGKDSSLRILFSNFTIHPISLSNKSYDETNYLQQQDNNYINLEDNNIIVTKEKQCESVFEFQSINKLLIKELNFTFHYRITKVKFKKSKEIKLEKLWDEGTFQLFNVTILFEWNIISLLQNTLNISNYNLFIQQLDNNNISNKTDDFIKKIEISNSLQTNFKSNFIGNYLSKQFPY
ncbi:hypothetical protein ABK040_001154 [Willaertia magna]